MQEANTQQQLELEQLYNKNQTTSRLRRYFEVDMKEKQGVNLKMFMKMAKIDIEFGFNLLVQIALHRRTDIPTMVGLLRHHFATAQEVADAIALACEVDMLDWNPAFSQLVVHPNLQIPNDVQNELDLFQFLSLIHI